MKFYGSPETLSPILYTGAFQSSTFATCNHECTHHRLLSKCRSCFFACNQAITHNIQQYLIRLPSNAKAFFQACVTFQDGHICECGFPWFPLSMFWCPVYQSRHWLVLHRVDVLHSLILSEILATRHTALCM